MKNNKNKNARAQPLKCGTFRLLCFSKNETIFFN